MAIDPLFLLFGLAVFVAVALACEGAYLWWNASRGPEARRLASRLRAISAGGHGEERASILKRRVLSESPAFARLLHRLPRIGLVDRLLVQSGLRLSVGELFGLSAILAAGGMVTMLLFGRGIVLGLAALAVCALLPTLYVFRARQQRQVKLESQLPDGIDLMVRALRAGHAFPTALQMVGDEMPEPLGGEFRILFDEINYGVTLQDALLNLASRVPSTDLRYFVVAVLIQRETGGNLAELLDNIAMLIRSRLKLLGQIRTLSAEGRLSAWILSLLPFGAAAMLNVVNPDFMAVLWRDVTGLKLIWTALFMMAFGIWWMRRIIRIHV